MERKMDWQACRVEGEQFTKTLKSLKSLDSRRQFAKHHLNIALSSCTLRDEDKQMFIKGFIEDFLDKSPNLAVYGYRLSVCKAFYELRPDSDLIWQGRLMEELYLLNDDCVAYEASLMETKPATAENVILAVLRTIGNNEPVPLVVDNSSYDYGEVDSNSVLVLAQCLAHCEFVGATAPCPTMLAMDGYNAERPCYSFFDKRKNRSIQFNLSI